MNIQSELDAVRRALLSECVDAESGDFDAQTTAAVDSALQLLRAAVVLGVVTAADLQLIRTAPGFIGKVRMVGRIGERLEGYAQ